MGKLFREAIWRDPRNWRQALDLQRSADRANVLAQRRRTSVYRSIPIMCS